MNKLPILCVMAAVAAFPQAQTPLTITQSAGSATGELRMQERRTNGTDYVGLKAPQSVAANTVWTLPSADGSSGQCLQTDGAGQWQWEACGNTRLVSDYNWSQVVGSRSGSGALTLTFSGTSCPAAGTDTNYKYRLYETSTPTTYELATSNGTGSCVRGGAGTIVATGPTGTYTNATATSASSGWQEAIFSVADGLPVNVRAAIGGYYVYSDILTEDRYLNAECEGPGAILVPMRNDVAVFHSAGPGGPRIRGCAINNINAYTGTRGIKTLNPDGNSFGTSIVDTQVTGAAVCYDLQTVYGVSAFTRNRAINCTDTALFLSNIETGDAGIGMIGPGNIFSDSVPGGAPYGIHWNGPGNLKIVGNSFNGYIEQIHLEPKMGVVNIVGTAVTRVSGPVFRASMVGGGFVASNTVASNVASVTDGSNLVLVSNAVTCTGCNYYVGNTGQMQITGNTLDSWTWTTHDIRAVSDLPFYNFQFDGNFTSNPNPSTFVAAISVEGAGFYFGSIKHNNFQTSYTASTKAVNLPGGNYIDVADNQMVNYLTGVDVGASAIGHTIQPGNHCTSVGTTNCVLSAASDTLITLGDPVTFAQLTAISAANGSTLFCSNCKQTSASSATCATGGTGANATRNNGAWKCDDGSAVNAYIQGGNSFGATAELGTNDAYGLAIKVNGTGIWSFPTAGHFYAGTNNTYDIGAGLSANSPRSVYAATSMVTPKIGRDTSAAFTIMTDSADRWIVNSAGMLYPAANDTYDAGLTGTRIRGVYAKFGEFFKSGSTAAADYVETRKYKVKDATGSTGSWDMQADVTATVSQLFSRDNAGDPFRYSVRQSSGSPVNYEILYASLIPEKRNTGLGHSVTDAAFPKLGTSSQPWSEIWGTNGDFAGDLTIDGTTAANVLNYASGTMAGTMKPLFGGTGSIGASGYSYGAAFFTASGFTLTDTTTVGYVWTATSTGGAGSWQAASGAALPVVDTTGIAKGSSDATKTVRFEVDGLTTGTTRALTVQDGNYTIAGLNINQTFVNPQTIAIASVQNQLTLSQTNNTGAYDPACLVLASTDTVGSTVYGAARLCAGYESAVFTNEKFAIQTATGSGTYQDALTVKNQALTVPGTLTVTGLTTFNGFVDMLGAGINYMYGTLAPQANNSGSIGTSGSRYGDFFGVRGNFTSATMGSTTSTVRLGQNLDLNYASDYAGAAINTWSATDGHGGVLDFNKSGSGTIGTHAAVVSGETLGFFVFRGSDGTAFQRGVEVNGEVDGAVSSGIVPGRMRIRTTNTSGTMTERLRIDSAGLTTITGNLTVTGTCTGCGVSFPLSTSVTFSSGSTYNIGSTSAPPLNVYGNYIEPLTELVMGSGVVFRGSLIPAANNTDAIGNTSFRVSNVATVNANISGTITTPSGSAGITSTKTVRDSAGTGTCTLIFSGGILTGGTC